MSIPVSTLTGSNTINQMMYNVNTIKDLAANSASSLTGPGSSTDNAVVRFDGTSGLTAQNSGVTIADDNSMIISGSSSGDMLRITQTGAGNALLVEDTTNPDSTPFVVDASGNVGIGTTAPGEKLNVSTGGSEYAIQWNSTGSDNWVLGSASNRAYIANKSTPLEVLTLLDGGNVGIGTNSPDGRLHVFSASAGTVTAASFADDLVVESNTTGGISILTTSADQGIIAWGDEANNFRGGLVYDHPTDSLRTIVGSAEAMRIDSSGNVGIGTSSPVLPLHISSATPAILLTDTDDNSDAQVSAAAGGLLVLDADIGNEVAGTAILFRVDGGSEKMRIDSSGNVGIGTSSPDAKLGVYSGSLGTTDGDQLELARFIYAASNGSYLRVFTERDGDGSVWTTAFTRIQQRVDSTDQGYIQFNGADNLYGISLGNNNTEYLRIENGGNVGIGTSSPAAALHVVEASTTNVSLTWGATAGQIFRNEDSELAIGLEDTSPYALYIQGRTNTDTARDIVLNPLGGNVGIGTQDPQNALEVAGTIESTSGGFKFPDGSTQTSAASAGITTGKAIAMAIVFG